MTEKLTGPVTPVLEPLGYRQDCGTSTISRIRHEIPDDAGQLVLHQQNIDEVLTCGGMCKGIATEIRAHVAANNGPLWWEGPMSERL